MPSFTASLSMASPTISCSGCVGAPCCFMVAYSTAASTSAAYRGSPLKPAWLTKSGLVVASEMRPVAAISAITSRSPVSTLSTVIDASCSAETSPSEPSAVVGREARAGLEPPRPQLV